MFQILVVVQMFLVVFSIDVIMRLVVVKRGFTSFSKIIFECGSHEKIIRTRVC